MLGSLLFLIYINDLSKIIQSSQIRMFADDTCLFVTNKDRELAQVTLNRDLDLISNWAHQWLVTFSPKGSWKFYTEVLYQPPPGKIISEPNITVHGSRLNVVQRFTYLGSTLSQNATIDDEVDIRIARASASFGRLNL